MIVELAGFICLFAALIVLFSNPKDRTSRLVAGLFLLFAIWHGTIVAGLRGSLFFNHAPNAPFFPWRRANAAVLGLCPWVIWMLKMKTIDGIESHRWAFRDSGLWLGGGVVLLIISLFESFVFEDPISHYAIRGFPYLVYGVVAFSLFTTLAFQSYKKARCLSGTAAVEMRLVVFNSAVACAMTILLTNIGNWLQAQPVRRAVFTIIPASVLLSTWAMTTSKFYSGRQIALAVGQRTTLAALLTLGAVGIWQYYQTKITSKVDVLLLVGLWSGGAFWLERKSRQWFDIGEERVLADARTATTQIALKERDPDKLAAAFEIFLTSESQVDFVTLLFVKGDTYRSNQLSLPKDSPGCATLCELGWATPESLERRRSTSGSSSLYQFLNQHSISLLIASPRGSQAPSLLIALGRKKLAHPFTYPEIQRLHNLAELIDNILIRSRLAMQAAAQARVEYLAMMSRGLAHDLKNLITPVSSFLIHTDNHFPAHTSAAEVHGAARRSVRIMTDYVREALFFSQKLAPQFELVDLEKLYGNVREIVTERAAERRVTVCLNSKLLSPFTADTVLLQRMLANLVSNSIDASPPGQTVSVSAEFTSHGTVRFEVRDQGTGIAPENLTRIFDPYFTTKQFGEKIRGFGLGLTICQKIVHLHGGTISVENGSPQGAVAIVELPPAPPADEPEKSAS